MSADEILQNKIESGNETHGTDADAYKIVFNSLKQNPQYKLSANFASNVSSRIASKKSFNWDYFLFVAAGISFLAVLIYAIALVKPTFSTGVFTFVSGYSGLVVFAMTFILLLNFIDKKLIRPSHS